MITIIIPLYNKEKYIGRAIKSIIKQTYTNFNAIIIDDFSTDDSYVEAKKQIGTDSRFIIYQNEVNMGVSFSRNKALDLLDSDTKYVCFLDADDEYLPNYLEEMHLSISKDAKIGVSFCGSYKNIGNKDSELLYNVRKGQMGCERALLAYLKNKAYPNTNSWMFKREITDNLRFDESISWGEDALFFTQALLSSDKCCYVAKVLNRYYVQEEKSLSTSSLSLIPKDILWLEKLRKSSDNFKVDRIIRGYRIPATIIYRLEKHIIIDNFDMVRQSYIEYKSYLKELRPVNGLRSIKLYLAYIKLLRKGL